MSEHEVARLRGMHVVLDGSPEAPPLLLIHGSGASGASWTPIVPALAAHHHVVRIDLPGCGNSAAAASYDVAAQADRVAALLDDLGLRHVPVAGHSSGGYCATALAERRPDLVRSIALISTGPSLDALLPEPLIVRILLGPPFGSIVWPIRTEAMIRRGLRATRARPIDVPADAVADFKRTSYRSFRQISEANAAYLAERAMPDRIAGLGLPVLVIFGAADPRWDPSSAQQYTAAPSVRLEMLAGVGHMPMLEAPDETSRLLLAFAASRAAGVS